MVGAIAETVVALDATSVAPSIFNVVVPESVTAQDSVGALAVFPTAFSDTVVVLDLAVGAFLWNLIDDTQAANWQIIPTTAAPGWQNISTEQSGNWQNIDTI